jgi:tetratricopeptide (TPR) repeat protein
MKTTIRLLAGIALLASCLPCLAQNPGPIAPETTAATHLTDSVSFYEAEEFDSSLLSAREALRMLNRTTAIAYNNICTAQIGLEQYDQAIEACLKALERSPKFTRARNNLEWIYEIQAEESPTAGVYLNLGEVRYWQGALDESIAASKRALELDPENAIAYNNLCAAHAAGGKWSEAVGECEKALEIDPEYELATSNLTWAQTGQVESP